MKLPTLEKFLAGLTPRDCHPPLVRSEQAAADADRVLELSRREFADRERLVAELPARILRGDVKASALAEALRERDAAALLVAKAEQSATKARERVQVEELNAKLAADRAFGAKVELLEKAAAEHAQELLDIKELAAALAATRGPGAILVSVDWPNSPRAEANMRAVAAASSPAPVPEWSNKPWSGNRS